MKLVKSLLLGSAAALVAGAGALAADLPARRAAPVEYVRICDAYGAGFFVIPGSDTCIKIGGRVRADFAASQRSTTYNAAFFNPNTNIATNSVAIDGDSANLYGWEARGRIDFDARTPTAWGTVQAVASLRLSRTTGILQSQSLGLVGGGASQGSTLEAAYIRFAGFTFGASRDNFSFMPSTFYGAGHWASFANGAKQIAYTAVLGGGFSATLAVQDLGDTTGGARNVNTWFPPVGAAVTTTPPGLFAYNTLPQINARVDWDQAWGSAALMGAISTVNQTNNTGILGTTGDASADKTVWAIGAGVKINLPMIAAGDVLYLNGAYADGMTEYTVNWLYTKTSDTRRNTGGFAIDNAPSWINYVDTNGNAGIQTLKSWNLAALYTHFWTPQWRHSFLVTGGRIEGSNVSNAAGFQFGGFGDATVWNAGTQLAWLPTRNFEIGVDILYNRVSQDVGRVITTSATPTSTTVGTGILTTREKEGNWTGRVRVERTF